MIVPDINLLVYAYSTRAPRHREARRWWESTAGGEQPVGVPWAVACGFIRLVTSSAVLDPPLPALEAVRRVREWFEVPSVAVLDPGPRHLEILEGLVRAVGVAGSLTTDAHLAAIAIEHQCELHSSDSDFSRFPGLRWRNPL